MAGFGDMLKQAQKMKAEMPGRFFMEGVQEANIIGMMSGVDAYHPPGTPANELTAPDGKRLYFACDTGLFGDMRLIGEEGIDLAALPIGDNFTMGPDDALRAVKLIQPKHVIPIHYNTWGLIAQDPDAWAKRVKAETKAQPHVLKPGESLEI